MKRFQAVDNIISYDYFKTLLPMLAERQLGVNLFYEVKSNLKPEQVSLLKKAGVYAIQPGVESLNSHVLKLMRKGVSALQNIQLLKFCRQYGVEPAWNLLYGFPGETPEDYEATAEYIPALYHLKPPGCASTIRLDRFSPNFDKADEFGLAKIRPFALYNFLYPLPPERVANLAYLFEYEYTDGRKPEEYLARTLDRVKTWKANKSGDLVKQLRREPGADGHRHAPGASADDVSVQRHPARDLRLLRRDPDARQHSRTGRTAIWRERSARAVARSVSRPAARLAVDGAGRQSVPERGGAARAVPTGESSMIINEGSS